MSKRVKILISILGVLVLLLIALELIHLGRKRTQGDAKTYFVEKLVMNLENLKTDFSIGPMYEKCDTEFYSEATGAVLGEHPEYFWLSGNATFNGVYSDRFSGCDIQMETICDLSQVPAMRERLEKEVEQIVSSANASCSNDYEKAKYVHDYLVQRCSYDEETYDNYMNGDRSVSLSHTAYGCLCNRLAVCEGYAKAYQLVMNRMEIECGFITGTAGSYTVGRGPHAWNYVKLEDGYYLVDVTWDDPNSSNADDISWDYFCISSVDMLKDHMPDTNQYIPAIDGTKYLQ